MEQTLFLSEFEGRSFELMQVLYPPQMVIRDLATQASYLAQYDAGGRLFALDENGRRVDDHWVRCVLERRRPRPKAKLTRS